MIARFDGERADVRRPFVAEIRTLAGVYFLAVHEPVDS